MLLGMIAWVSSINYKTSDHWVFIFFNQMYINNGKERHLVSTRGGEGVDEKWKMVKQP